MLRDPKGCYATFGCASGCCATPKGCYATFGCASGRYAMTCKSNLSGEPDVTRDSLVRRPLLRSCLQARGNSRLLKRRIGGIMSSGSTKRLAGRRIRRLSGNYKLSAPLQRYLFGSSGQAGCSGEFCEGMSYACAPSHVKSVCANVCETTPLRNFGYNRTSRGE
jgi:hypothetical protein